MSRIPKPKQNETLLQYRERLNSKLKIPKPPLWLKPNFNVDRINTKMKDLK